ncbi:MAG: hypothetical protein U0798_07150 [Gemmataceae bacterium]
MKVIDGGLPEWLDGGPMPIDDAFPADLRKLAELASWASKVDGKKVKRPSRCPIRCGPCFVGWPQE